MDYVTESLVEEPVLGSVLTLTVQNTDASEDDLPFV